MKLWPPCSEIMEFLISSYRIVQLNSVKFCTLIKDENRDILIFISRRALAREGDYEMMPVCSCVRACVRVCVR